jgi:hypothetical protein
MSTLDGFELLLTKLGIKNEEKKRFLIENVDKVNKKHYLHFCRSVLNDDEHFSRADEDMLTVLDYDRHMDIFRLLTLKHRILNSNTQVTIFIPICESYPLLPKLLFDATSN